MEALDSKDATPWSSSSWPCRLELLVVKLLSGEGRTNSRQCYEICIVERPRAMTAKNDRSLYPQRTRVRRIIGRCLNCTGPDETANARSPVARRIDCPRDFKRSNPCVCPANGGDDQGADPRSVWLRKIGE
ncbi:hypothetical protein BDV93DRAFT_176641 [Ceratobasidium sp. AG-I]|nr:hypothetical protein BDV93DRAFT_176641 [Ceratobasidium sp. AG-I]